MNELPDQLKSLIHDVSRIYGESIFELHGRETFRIIESVRVRMKESRGKNHEQLKTHLAGTNRRFRHLPLATLSDVAHILAVYLELINRCEAAFRHYRIQQKPPTPVKRSPHAIICVFTAHPTEAKDPRALNLFKLIDAILVEWLSSPQKKREEKRLRHLLKLLLKARFSKNVAPKVEDEIVHITSIVLDAQLLAEQIRLHQQGIIVHFRTWVGGDKDGHPFVSKVQMKRCLQTSRRHLATYAQKEVAESRTLLANVSGAGPGVRKLIRDHESVSSKIDGILKLERHDGERIARLRRACEKLISSYRTEWGEINHHLNNLRSLIWLYPALILPLELREDSAVVLENGAEAKKVSEMLATIRTISRGADPKWYVKGFILSMVNNARDLNGGVALVKKHFRKITIPVIPLFETRNALTNAQKILGEFFEHNRDFYKTCREEWDAHYEVMLGYSDSAKENGTLASRYLIAETMNTLDSYLKTIKLTPIFFHGSGGSVERGGGSIRDQVAWMPESSLDIFKSTVQGEMVFRNFGDEVIMRSMVEKIVAEFAGRKRLEKEEFPEGFKRLAQLANDAYQKLVTADDFPAFVKASTPYQFLSDLKIGSRPSRRGKSSRFRLRAIPWVLCWTQTRVLLPSWWGVGTAWKKLTETEKLELIAYYGHSPFFQSYMKILGFTLAKVELGVFYYYLKQGRDSAQAEQDYEMLCKEFELTKRFFQKLTGHREFLWFRPWLQESIHFRSPMIHPLNFIQLRAIEKMNLPLLRETVSGIASGMMTTG
jgi:phosphoenolpyruvate carboxylase